MERERERKVQVDPGRKNIKVTCEGVGKRGAQAREGQTDHQKEEAANKTRGKVNETLEEKW